MKTGVKKFVQKPYGENEVRKKIRDMIVWKIVSRMARLFTLAVRRAKRGIV